MTPQVSVIVPTHNRAERLPATLDALARQDWPPDEMEAILVADGCADDTAGAFARWQPPFATRLLEQPPAGPATARNRGASEARGQYLIFLDDDIHAAPGLVRAHVEAHAGRAGLVVIGYLPAQVRGSDFFSIALRGWWEAMFRQMRAPGHRFTFRDLLSGNFSLERELFEQSGGFDTELRCHEDYELGLRLLDAGARFHFEPRAVGMHDEHTHLRAASRRKFEEGRADAWLLRRRPELLPVLPLHYISATSARRRLLRRLAVSAPAAGDAFAWLLERRLPWYEAWRLRFRWRAVLEDLFFYWYWRGIVVACGGAPDLDAMHRRAAEAIGGEVVEIDLADGLAAAEGRLDRERPAGATLRHGPHRIGTIPDVPGAERLCGAHLRPLLANDLIDSYVRALALAGELPPAVDSARVLEECRSPEMAGAAAGTAAVGA